LGEAHQLKRARSFTQTDYSDPTDATRIRALLAALGLGQRAAARELDISERDMRSYCSGAKVPRVVMLALERLVDQQRKVQ
jgi:DNA-binding transcriptional regulator YiaG